MNLNPIKAVIKTGKTALLICDIQERFAKAIYNFDKIVYNSKKLINACNVLNVPIIVTEQNPKSLGKIVPELDISCAKGVFKKMQFSMVIPEVENSLLRVCPDGPVESVLLIGVEAHGCIENSAIDLMLKGYEVHVLADCCSSRSQEERLLAFKRMSQIGCQISTAETIIFKLLKHANHKNFKDIQKIIAIPTKHTGLVSIS